MYDFVINKKCKHQENEIIIKNIEKKYSIKIPDILKEYYLKYDNEPIKNCKVKEDMLSIVQITPINSSEEYSFEKLKEEYLNEAGIPESIYPLAEDKGGDLYCWDSKTENVYYYFHEFIDEPNKVCNSIEEFFKCLENSLSYMEESYD